MTSTNRTLNRVVLVLVGLLLLAAGAAALVLAATPDGAARWETLRAWVDDAVQRAWSRQVDLSGIGLGLVPWTLALAPVVVLVLVALLVAFVAAQGRGRTRDVVADRALPEAPATATYSVDVAIAQTVVADAVRGSRLVDPPRVAAYRSGARRALRVVVGVRRGAMALQAMHAVQHGLSVWDELAGEELPTVLHLVRGSRSVRTARPAAATAAPVRPSQRPPVSDRRGHEPADQQETSHEGGAG